MTPATPAPLPPWRAGATRVLDGVLAVLLAPCCVACARPLDTPTQGAVCPTCWAVVQRTPRPAHASLGPLLTTIGSAASYDGPVTGIIQALKYEGRGALAAPLGALMRERGADILAGATCVVPVPLHPWRRLTRGFNQSAALAGHLGLPLVHALWRPHATAPQAGLHATERRQNVRRAFALAPWLGASRRDRLRGMTVVLVDDVHTTGATLEACAVVLRAAGVREVRALTVARAAPPKGHAVSLSPNGQNFL